MAILYKETVFFLNNKFEKVLKYSVRDKNFYIELPEEINKSTGKGTVSGSTQDIVEREFRKICKEFENTLKEVRKVIAYQFQANYKNPNDSSKDRKDFYFFDGTTFGIDYFILLETDLNGTKRYTTEKDVYFNMTDEYKIIPWTPSAQKFFENTDKALNDLISHVDNFLQDEGTLLQFIASNRPLLLKG